MRYEAPNETLWATHLRTGQIDLIRVGSGSAETQRLEDHIVSALIDFDDIAYDEHADLLYDLSEQVTRHLLSYLSDESARKVLRLHEKEIARLIHAQMQGHFWEDPRTGYEVVITRGFTALRPSAYTAAVGEPPHDFRKPPSDRSNMARYLFGGFKKCLYATQKFQSDPERKLAVILEREALKWFKPAKGQFQLHYRSGTEHLEYQPDFVAETEDGIFMLEPKASNQMTDRDVLAKRDAAIAWCQHASAYAKRHEGKQWIYALISHDLIAENMTLAGLIKAGSAVRPN